MCPQLVGQGAPGNPVQNDGGMALPRPRGVHRGHWNAAIAGDLHHGDLPLAVVRASWPEDSQRVAAARRLNTPDRRVGATVHGPDGGAAGDAEGFKDGPRIDAL